MGLLGAIGVVRSIQRLKSGKSKYEIMSVADILMVSVNGSEARKNLTAEQFQDVNLLYNEIKTVTEKRAFTLDEYLNVTTLIMALFDSIAPFELYCGSEEIASQIRMMKQDPSYYEFRETILNNPDLLFSLGSSEAEKADDTKPTGEEVKAPLGDKAADKAYSDKEISQTEQSSNQETIITNGKKSIDIDSEVRDTDNVAQNALHTTSANGSITSDQPKKSNFIKVAVGLLAVICAIFVIRATVVGTSKMSAYEEQACGHFVYAYSANSEKDENNFEEAYDANLDSEITASSDGTIVLRIQDKEYEGTWFVDDSNAGPNLWASNSEDEESNAILEGNIIFEDSSDVYGWIDRSNDEYDVVHVYERDQ